MRFAFGVLGNSWKRYPQLPVCTRDILLGMVKDPGFIPLIPPTIVNVLNFFIVNMKKDDQQVMSTQIRSLFILDREGT